MLFIIGALLIVMDLTQVLEHISQISNFALISIVPAHNNFLSWLNAMHEISGEEEFSD